MTMCYAVYADCSRPNTLRTHPVGARIRAAGATFKAPGVGFGAEGAMGLAGRPGIDRNRIVGVLFQGKESRETGLRL